MIMFKVSELESSEGVPGLGGGDQAGFALWLTLLQVSFWFSHYFIIFALWLYIAAGLFFIALNPVCGDYVMLINQVNESYKWYCKSESNDDMTSEDTISIDHNHFLLLTRTTSTRHKRCFLPLPQILSGEGNE